jgi:hypothetical protein
VLKDFSWVPHCSYLPFSIRDTARIMTLDCAPLTGEKSENLREGAIGSTGG